MKRSLLAALVLAPALLSAQATPSGLKKDIAAVLDDASQKLIALANAIPPAKFNWRPAPGVRSVSEVFVHVSMENYDIPPMAGLTASPAKVDPDAEKKLTDKAAVIDYLTKSYAYARQSILAAADAQMDTQANYFGTPMSRRGILMQLATHGHEHLGQLIAYARMNNIVPPWSK